MMFTPFFSIFAPALRDLAKEYVPNEKGEEFVGLGSIKMIWQTNFGVDDSEADAGNSGLRLSVFNITSRGDSAHIQLLNSSGSPKTIYGCTIRGKPRVRYSGDQGYVHDSLINYDDIVENGEKKFEFGNNYVCAEDQLRRLADWHWKSQRSKRHIYQVSMFGHCHWFSPGEWWVLQILVGGELIDSVCECCDAQVEGAHGSIGQTLLTLREVYANWTFNTNAVSRFVAQGSARKIFSHNSVKIASATYTNPADYYCDGAADEVVINNAIDALTGIGGGVIELMEDVFKIDDAIAPLSKTAITGHGWNTIIEKNMNAYAVDVQGTVDAYKENIIIRDLKITRDATDVNSIALVHLKYARNVILENLIVDDSYGDGVVVENCENIKLINCVIDGAEVNGVVLKQTLQAAVFSCLIASCGGVGCKLITDDTVDMIDRGDCESETPPMFAGETVPLLIGCTWARSNAQARAGIYSYKFTKTAAAGSLGMAYLTDSSAANDLHGLTPGKSYRFKYSIFLPTGQVTQGPTDFVAMRAFVMWAGGAAWRSYGDIPLAVFNAWQDREICFTLPLDAVCAFIEVHYHVSVPANKYVYVDEIYLYESTYENNGYTINNCTIKNNASHGIYIATNEAQVVDNRLIDNGAVSLYIAGGKRNKVMGNDAVRNGSYAIEDNFYDGGADTFWN